ncbi:MAG: PQQ-dependent dehydrogenase, methanol/ethanol family [Sphingobium sp.]|nr:PQQ-dependent dehydrogenase, methanol/ethanol family [Sphingobium sp.]
MKATSARALALSALVLLAACNQPGSGGAVKVDGETIAAGTDGDWLSYGRTYDEQRFSPLDQINDANAKDLGLVWYADLDSARGQEATPLAIDGILYTTTAWSMVKAYDGTTGKPLWAYDPKVARETVVKACCDAVNRGLAAWGDTLFVATLDARLVALDRKTGKVLWETRVAPADSNVTITGAPRVVKGKVIIGSGGAEYDVRGFVAAFDVETGKEAWRFFTVPGDPSKPFENEAMAMAAKTWSGNYWRLGGGGTVWDSITYDPKTGLLYFGTGNGEPWNIAERDPDAGDNLFAASIVAVDPETGKYVWHFQETPQDRWDFDSDAQIMLADLKIGGKDRRVVMHAPKNGFFYVLDAKTGEYLSGKAFTAMNWASGLDAKGRPIVNPEAHYEKTGKLFVGLPGAGGAHSWQAMSFSPKTGLVYIPVNLAGFPYAATGKDWKPEPMGMNNAQDGSKVATPADAAIRKGLMASVSGELLAWDPVKQKAAWRAPYVGPWNGGTLATAGNIVVQGSADGFVQVYNATDGKKLWSFAAQTGVIAPAMTYRAKGEQYVAVMAGWGGVWALAPGLLSRKSGATQNISRLLVFKLGGTAKLPAPPRSADLVLDPPPNFGTPQQLAIGEGRYQRYCGTCHGDAAIAGGLTPDLRHSTALGDPAVWQAIVHDGGLAANGMVGWAKVMKPAEIDSIRAYVVSRANQDKLIGPAPLAPVPPKQ